VLPELTVRVEWISGEHAILGCQDLQLVDRPLLVGDTVSQMRDISRRGVVIRSECFADVKFLQSGEVVKAVSTGQNLKPICDLEPDLFVVYQHWLGQIYEFTKMNVVVLFDSGVQMKLKTSQVAQLQVLHSDMPTDLPFVLGQRVHYPPNGDGIVLAVLPTRCCVEWIAPSQVHGEDHSMAEPPDQTCEAAVLDSFLPPSYASTRWRLFQHGVLVRPEEEGEEDDEEEEEESSPPSEASGEAGSEAGEGAVKNVARSKGVGKGRFFTRKGKGIRKSRKSEKQKAEAMTPDDSLREQASKCVQIMSTKTVCDVRWGDGNIERGVPGVDLHALEHLGNHDFFPEDFVVEEEDVADEMDILPAAAAPGKPEKLGVVLTSNFAERTCKVHWFGTEEEEEVAVYELSRHQQHVFRLEDVVLRLPASHPPAGSSLDPPQSWVGFVTGFDRGLVQVLWQDGTCEPMRPEMLTVLDQEEPAPEEGDPEEDDEGSWQTVSTVSDEDPMEEEDPAPALAAAEAAEPADEEEEETSEPFALLEHAGSQHHFAATPSTVNSVEVQRAWKRLKKDLPDKGIWVRAFEDRIDLLRACIAGPDGTPYEGALFFFDIQLPSDYPQAPPPVHYYHHSGGPDRLNPNLYKEGKVCLSLLGTWQGDEGESWKPGKSNLIQLLLSIQGLVLVPAPYYCEPGFERQMGTEEGKNNSQDYSEAAYLMSLRAIRRVVRHPLDHFHAVVKDHFAEALPTVLSRCKALCAATEEAPLKKDDIFHPKPSQGFQRMLKKQVPHVTDLVKELEVIQQLAEEMAKAGFAEEEV